MEDLNHQNIKISLITTVYNEEKEIEGFLRSVLDQVRLPNEVVIADADSQDETIKRIQRMVPQFERKKIFFRLIRKPGNRAVGRNEAVRKTRYDHIVCSDVGCILDGSWLQELEKGFVQGAEVVAGYYQGTSNDRNIHESVFQRCLATYTSVMPDRLDQKTYLPSSRSIGFTKKAWEKVGGYPEKLEYCEDLIFARNLKQTIADKHFIVQKDATVYWPQKKTLKEAFHQFFNYARGDGQARYIRPQTPLLFLRYVVGLILVTTAFFYPNAQVRSIALQSIAIALPLYLLWAILKNWRYVPFRQSLFILPALQLTADFAVMLGMLTGVQDHIE